MEIADARGLNAVAFFGVDPSGRIYEAQPIFNNKAALIFYEKKSSKFWDYVFGWPWSFFGVGKALRQKKIRQQLSLKVTTYSWSDWTEVQEQIVDLLENNRFEDVAMESSRGSIYCTARKDFRGCSVILIS